MMLCSLEYTPRGAELCAAKERAGRVACCCECYFQYNICESLCHAHPTTHFFYTRTLRGGDVRRHTDMLIISQR